MNYYRTVTFQPPTETLTNFPVLVRIRNDRMGSRILSPKGWDVCFELDGNRLPFELDWYDAASGSGAWWVQIPTLSSSAPTSIRMLYGDSSITSDQSAPGTVWADYSYVYHFSGSDPFRDVRGGKTASTSIPYSVVNSNLVPTGQALRITPTEKSFFYFAEQVNVSVGTVFLSAHVSKQFEFKWKTSYYSYGFSGYTSPYSIFGAGLTFTPEITFPTRIYYSANCGSAGAEVLFNGTFFDCSASDRQEWFRDDSHCFETFPPCVTSLDELRISKTVRKSSAWLQYEQNQMENHESVTEYSLEFDSSGNALPSFFPWIQSGTVLD
ncbi:MAG: DUF2341 domain-containing protein [Thermoguttaceae bacterium]|nr:DUF2341 domain-containing protein [Thermoguttaceae bacterium]